MDLGSQTVMYSFDIENPALPPMVKEKTPDIIKAPNSTSSGAYLSQSDED